MRPLPLIALAVLTPAALAACGDRRDGMSEPAGGDYAWTDDLASCGLEMQDRMAWGLGVNGSELEMQEVTAEGPLVLRVWSPQDAELKVEDGVVSGTAQAPAWIAAAIAPSEGYMVHLDEGSTHLRVELGSLNCAPTAQGES